MTDKFSFLSYREKIMLMYSSVHFVWIKKKISISNKNNKSNSTAITCWNSNSTGLNWDSKLAIPFIQPYSKHWNTKISIVRVYVLLFQPNQVYSKPNLLLLAGISLVWWETISTAWCAMCVCVCVWIVFNWNDRWTIITVRICFIIIIITTISNYICFLVLGLSNY